LGRRTFLAGSAASGAALLGACSGSGPSSSATGSTGAKAQTVEMWIWETVDQWNKVVQLADLSKALPGVTIKFSSIPNAQLTQKALTQLSSGVKAGLPDIIRINTNAYRQMVRTQGLYDFTDVITPHKADIVPAVYEGLPIDGKIYAMPDDTGVMLYGYRDDLFKKAGLPYKQDDVQKAFPTWDALLTEAGPKLHSLGIALLNNNPDYIFTNMILQDTTGLFDENADVIFDDAAHVQCAEIVKKYWDSGYCSTFENYSPQLYGAYKDDKLASMFYPLWLDFTMLDNVPENKGKWTIAQLPGVSSTGRRASTQDGCLLLVPAALDEDRRNTAVEVTKFLNLNAASGQAHMKVFAGAMTSYLPALDKMTDVKSPYLDDQYTYKIGLAEAKSQNILPNYRNSVFYTDAFSAAGNAMIAICQKNAPIQATLKTAADSIRKMQDSQNVK